MASAPPCLSSSAGSATPEHFLLALQLIPHKFLLLTLEAQPTVAVLNVQNCSYRSDGGMLSFLIAHKAKNRMKSSLKNLLPKNLSPHRFQLRSRLALLLAFLTALLVCAIEPCLHADPTPVRKFQGTYHGFLELRSPDGQVVAFGDSTQVVHGDQITAETLFTFKDGSIDDETT